MKTRSNIKPEILRDLAALIPTLKQCKGALRRDDAFCYQGALCEIYRQHTKQGRWVATPVYEDMLVFVYPYLGVDRTLIAVINTDLERWATVDAKTPRIWVPEYNRHATLIELNDRIEWPFARFSELDVFADLPVPHPAQPG